MFEFFNCLQQISPPLLPSQAMPFLTKTPTIACVISICKPRTIINWYFFHPEYGESYIRLFGISTRIKIFIQTDLVKGWRLLDREVL